MIRKCNSPPDASVSWYVEISLAIMKFAVSRLYIIYRVKVYCHYIIETFLVLTKCFVESYTLANVL